MKIILTSYKISGNGSVSSLTLFNEHEDTMVQEVELAGKLLALAKETLE